MGDKKKYDEVIVRRLDDMKEMFLNPNYKGNPVIYKVYIKKFPGFNLGINVMNPGDINKEYFMTKGHKHKIPSEEIYILAKGKGKLLIEGKKPKTIDMKKGKICIIPKNSSHRLINTGKTKMEVLTFYSEKSDHTYGIKFKKRFFKKNGFS